MYFLHCNKSNSSRNWHDQLVCFIQAFRGWFVRRGKKQRMQESGLKYWSTTEREGCLSWHMLVQIYLMSSNWRMRFSFMFRRLQTCKAAKGELFWGTKAEEQRSTRHPDLPTQNCLSRTPPTPPIHSLSGLAYSIDVQTCRLTYVRPRIELVIVSVGLDSSRSSFGSRLSASKNENEGVPKWTFCLERS